MGSIALLVGLGTYTIFNPIIKPICNGGPGMCGNPKLAHIETIQILGINQTYKIHQQINFHISWTGYWSRCGLPDVKIMDSQNKTVWNMRQPLLLCGMGLGNGGFISSKMIGYPILNDTGTYTMIASIGNKTAQQSFNVTDEIYTQISPPVP